MIWWERAEREDIAFGAVHQFFDLGELWANSNDVLVTLGDSSQDVAGEMHAASLPAPALQRLTCCCFQAFMTSRVIRRR